MSSATIAQLKGDKITASTSKGQTAKTNVGSAPREGEKTSTAVDTTKFPFDLSSNRYVEIKIYNTAAGDPNKDLLDAGGALVGAAAAGFKAFSGEEDFLAQVTAGFGAVGSGIGSAFESAQKGATETFKQYSKNFDKNGFGNAPLPETFKDKIFLPLPNEIAENLSHTYKEEGGITDTIDELTGGVGTALVGKSNAAGIGSLTGLSNLVSKATGRQAILYNKNKLAMFESSAFRSITLNWTMIPNNQREAHAIHTIITKMKAYSSPQAVANKLLLRAPFFARLEFHNKVINDALQFKEVVITGIDVNYTVSGHMETFHDDIPKTVSMSVTFQDREPKTLQAWGNGAYAESGYEAGQ